MSYIAYQFVNGVNQKEIEKKKRFFFYSSFSFFVLQPWRRMYVRYNYNPMLHPQSVYQQVMDYRVPKDLIEKYVLSFKIKKIKLIFLFFSILDGRL